MVSTVTTVCALDPLMVTETGIVHVAGSLTAVGVIAQLRLITPIKPSKSVKLIVEVFPIVAASVSIVSVDETMIALL